MERHVTSGHPGDSIMAVNDFLALIVTVLSVVMIFFLPRLNIIRHKLFNRFGMMHLVAIHIIGDRLYYTLFRNQVHNFNYPSLDFMKHTEWIQTLFKESIHEAVSKGKDESSNFLVSLKKFYHHHQSNDTKHDIFMQFKKRCSAIE